MGSVIVGPSCDVLEVKESCLCVIHTVVCSLKEVENRLWREC